MRSIARISQGFAAALCVVVLTVMSGLSAQAVPYTVANTSTVPIMVNVMVDCTGGGAFPAAPANLIIPVGSSHTWNVPPPPCVVVGVQVNGSYWMVPNGLPLPYCYNLFNTPPYRVCFTGGVPEVVVQ